jgi:pentalenolactone synthase
MTEAAERQPDGPARRIQTPAGDPAWQVSGYRDVRALLTDPRLGTSHPDPERAARASTSAIFGGPRGSSENERENHTRMRTTLGPTFSLRRMESLRVRIQAMADQLLDEMERHGPPADLHESLAFPLPALVICELLGVPYADREDFRRWSDDAARMNDAARSRAGLVSLRDYVRGLIARKRQAPAEDVISDLVAARDERGEFSEDEIVTMAAGLLFAGHETTVAAIDRGTLLLLTNSEQREAILRDPALVPAAVEEILRSRMPIPERVNTGLPRYANAELALGEAAVQTGELVLLDHRGANQDACRFAEPERFDVAREDNLHLAFGHGPHYCLGAPLARVELQVVFGTLFRRFPGLRLAVDVSELHTRSWLLAGGLTALPVTW